MVSASPITTEIHCSQCGGELHPGEGQIFLTCPFCSATVYLDLSRVVFHWYVNPTIDDQGAATALFRWMSGSQTVKDLDKKARLVGQSFQYFPVWYFKWKEKNGKVIEAIQPAAATSITEITALKLPAGDLRAYDSALDGQSAAPSVPYETGLTWARERNPGGEGDMEEASLVHIPLYFFKYAFRDQTYTAVVDAASGSVLANLFPPKQENPYRVVAIVAALIYLCLATVPLVMVGSDSGTGIGTGLLVCGGLGLLAAPILFAWAFWVASKV